MNAEFINRDSITDQNKNYYLNKDVEEWKVKSKEFMQLLRGKVVDKSRYRTVNATQEPPSYGKVRNSFEQKHDGNEYRGWT